MTAMTHSKEYNMKEELIYKIEKIVKNEKFKLDAFFLCGAPSGLPDDSLKKACERYLEAVKNDTKDDSVTEALIAELKRHLDTEPAIKVVGDITDNRDELRELYENRAYL